MTRCRFCRPDLMVGAALMVALAGCAAEPTPPSPAASAQAGTNQAGTNQAGTNLAGTNQTASGQTSEYGTSLAPSQYSDLVMGNTLFRPLQSGGKTLIYVVPDQSLRLRIQTADGRILSDTGSETLEPGKVCWQWAHAGTDCFAYYWNGRLMTFVPTEKAILPAQFLVQKGNAEGL